MNRAYTRKDGLAVLPAYLPLLMLGAVSFTGHGGFLSGQDVSGEALLVAAYEKRAAFPPCTLTIVITSTGLPSFECDALKVQYSDGDYLCSYADGAAGMMLNNTLHIYDNNSCIIVPTDYGHYLEIFDPRTLGISSSYQPQETIDSTFCMDRAKNAQGKGRESVGGIECEIVEVARPETAHMKRLWINRRSGNVLKVEGFEGGRLSTRTINEYDNANKLANCPSTVNYESFSIDGRPRFGFTLRISVEDDPEISGLEFTLGSLGMKVGSQVSDIRTKLMLGYWDGSKIIDHSNPSAARPAVQPSGFSSSWIFIGAGVLLLAAATFKYVRSKSSG
jgi:hypothetical protein